MTTYIVLFRGAGGDPHRAVVVAEDRKDASERLAAYMAAQPPAPTFVQVVKVSPFGGPGVALVASG